MINKTVAAVLVATSCIAAAPCSAQAVAGGYALTYADADYANPPAGTSSGGYSSSGLLQSATSDQGPGANTTAKSESAAWLNRIDIASSATDPRAIVIGSAGSFFAVNQQLTGQAGTTATVSYTFGIDGSFTPGNPGHYPPAGFAPPQNLTFYLLAYSGTALATEVRTDGFGTYLNFESSNGNSTLSRGPGTPGYSNDNLPFLLGGAVACFGMDMRCTNGGVFDDSRTISFDIGVGESYYVVGYLTSNTNGYTNFFNTAKLQTIALAPQFGLISDDGGVLRRAADGSFALAVPEPGTWALMGFGFAAVGGAMRRRSTRTA